MSEDSVTFDDLELDLSLTPRVGPGRQAKPLKASYSRDLSRADLAAPTAPHTGESKLVRLRDSHHALARVLATGAGEGEASAITGYTPGRISVLKADPQFQELLEFYRAQGASAVADYRERMVNVGLDALNMLTERMEEKPEEFTPGLLKDIARDMADRTGHAPQKGPSSVTQINVNLSDKMAAARERVASAKGAGTIEGPSPSSPSSATGSVKVIDHE